MMFKLGGRVPFKGAYIKISINDTSIQLSESDNAAAVIVVSVCVVAVDFDGMLCVVRSCRLVLSLGILSFGIWSCFIFCFCFASFSYTNVFVCAIFIVTLHFTILSTLPAVLMCDRHAEGKALLDIDGSKVSLVNCGRGSRS
jgi:hypothetical protein